MVLIRISFTDSNTEFTFHCPRQTRTQSLFMSLGERERRLDCIEARWVTCRAPQQNPIFSPFPPDSLIATGYESVPKECVNEFFFCSKPQKQLTRIRKTSAFANSCVSGLYQCRKVVQSCYFFFFSYIWQYSSFCALGYGCQKNRNDLSLPMWSHVSKKYVSNSLIIRKEKTKEITTVMVVWILNVIVLMLIIIKFCELLL